MQGELQSDFLAPEFPERISNFRQDYLAGKKLWNLSGKVGPAGLRETGFAGNPQRELCKLAG